LLRGFFRPDFTGISSTFLLSSISRPLFPEKADAGDDRLSAGRTVEGAAHRRPERRFGLVEAIGHAAGRPWAPRIAAAKSAR